VVGRNACGLSMGEGRGVRLFDAKGFCIVMPGHVDAEAVEHVGDIATDAGGFSAMGGLIFAELTIHVVCGEQGVVPGAGLGGTDGEVDHAMRLILVTEECMLDEGPTVLLFFVGDEDQGGMPLWGAFSGEAVKQVSEGALEAARLEGPGTGEHAHALLLGGGGSAAAAEGGVGGGEDKEGVGGDGEGDVVGEVLGDIEGDEAVEADGLMGMGKAAHAAVDCQGLTGKPVDTVLDGGTGGVEGSGQGTDAHGRAEEHFELEVGDCPFGEVIEAEGLSREICAAGATTKTLDLAEGLRRVEAGCHIPLPGGCLLMVATVFVGTERNLVHGFSSSFLLRTKPQPLLHPLLLFFPFCRLRDTIQGMP